MPRHRPNRRDDRTPEVTSVISWRWLVGHQVAVLVVLVAAGAFTRPWPTDQALVEALVLATALPVAVAAVVSAVRSPRSTHRRGSGRRPVAAEPCRGALARLRSFVSRTWIVPVSWGLPDAFAALVLPLALRVAGRDRWADVALIGATPGLLAAAAWLVVVLVGGMGAGAVAAIVTVVRGVGPASWRRGTEFSRAASTGGGLMLLGLLTTVSALFFVQPAHGGRGVGLLLVVLGVSGQPGAPATVLVRTGAAVIVVGAAVWFGWSRLDRRRQGVPAMEVSAARGRSPRGARARGLRRAPRGGPSR